MKKIIAIFRVALIAIFVQTMSAAISNASLVYHEYKSESAADHITGETFIDIVNASDEETIVKRRKQYEHCRAEDEFVLDRDYSLLRWTRVCDGDDTNFTSTRDGNMLIIRGKKKGEAIDMELELGNKALHIYPKYSLSKFALSGMPKMKFWSLRRDKLSKLPMQAIRKGTETIMVNGEQVEVIKVYYSITGKLREKHFNHNYYFRKSDGMYLKKEENTGKVEVLVKEK